MRKQKKQAGFIVTAELVLVATILVIGMIVGMAVVRDAVTAEMHDVAEAIGELNQSYYLAGITALNSLDSTLAIIDGSDFEDTVDGEAGDLVPVIYTTVPPALEAPSF